MLGMSYGQLFFLLGATAALVGTKDLPKIARVAGRLAGRAIGYVQLARGQFESVMQQSQARQVHKELQDTMAQLEAIRHEIRSISLVNPGPMTRSVLNDPPEPTPNGNSTPAKHEEQQKLSERQSKVSHFMNPMQVSQDISGPSSPIKLQAQAAAYARLAESEAVKFGRLESSSEDQKISDDPFTVLPVSAESAGFLPARKGSVAGSDIMLEAVAEAEVAHNAKDFFAKPENQLK